MNSAGWTEESGRARRRSCQNRNTRVNSVATRCASSCSVCRRHRTVSDMAQFSACLLPNHSRLHSTTPQEHAESAHGRGAPGGPQLVRMLREDMRNELTEARAHVFVLPCKEKKSALCT